MEFDFLGSLSKFAHLRFLGVIEKLSCGAASFRLTWLTKDRLVL